MNPVQQDIESGSYEGTNYPSSGNVIQQSMNEYQVADESSSLPSQSTQLRSQSFSQQYDEPQQFQSIEPQQFQTSSYYQQEPEYQQQRPISATSYPSQGQQQTFREGSVLPFASSTPISQQGSLGSALPAHATYAPGPVFTTSNAIADQSMVGGLAPTAIVPQNTALQNSVVVANPAISAPAQRYEMYTIEIHNGPSSLANAAKGKIKVSLHGISAPGVQQHAMSSPFLPLIGNKKAFTKDRTDIFFVVTPDVGFLDRVTVKVDGIVANKWKLNQMIIRCNGKKWRCYHNDVIHDSVTLQLDYLEDSSIHHNGGQILLGPIARYRGLVPQQVMGDALASYGQSYGLTFLMVTLDIPQLSPIQCFSSRDGFSSVQYQPNATCYYQYHNYKMWRYDVEIPMGLDPQILRYVVPDGRQFDIEIPGLQQKPNIAFGSCIDRAHPFGIVNPADKNVVWEYMLSEHMQQPKHLLVLGGDQVYADSVFTGCEELVKWKTTKKPLRWGVNLSDNGVRQAECYYFKTYLECWSQDPLKIVFATIPNLMMWDDHDIYDGYGSLDPLEGNSDCLQKLFQIAKRHYFLFQMQGDLRTVITENNVNGPYHSFANCTGNVGVLLLDLRSSRKMYTTTSGEVIDSANWLRIENWFHSKAAQAQQQLLQQQGYQQQAALSPQTVNTMLLQPDLIKHLFVVSSVPVVYPHSNFAEKLFTSMKYNLRDDVRDHWGSNLHQVELQRLLEMLYQFGKNTHCKSTFLAGDVHCGGYGTIRDTTDNTLIEQFISSGICANPPPAAARSGMRTWSFKQVAGKYRTQYERLPNQATKSYFLATQNYLSLLPNNAGSYTAKWVARPVAKMALPRPLPNATTLAKEIY